YTYLEIGSHLGGSLQTHVIDSRCHKVYSIDPRPQQLSDDRQRGHTVKYPDNSTERMLTLLANIPNADVSKVACFELTTNEIAPCDILQAPDLIFIDGQHTYAAVLSDFAFCYHVAKSNSVILFHDSWIVLDAI